MNKKKIKSVMNVFAVALLLFSTLSCFLENRIIEEIDGPDNTTVNSSVEDGTPVILEMNDTEVRATLNNTLTAQEFIKILPYTITVSRATDDLCGSVSEELPSIDSEGQSSWEIGEIGWFGCWFTIFVDHEEKFSHMPGIMIIGKIDDDYIDIVKSFSGRVDIVVRLAE